MTMLSPQHQRVARARSNQPDGVAARRMLMKRQRVEPDATTTPARGVRTTPIRSSARVIVGTATTAPRPAAATTTDGPVDNSVIASIRATMSRNVPATAQTTTVPEASSVATTPPRAGTSSSAAASSSARSSSSAVSGNNANNAANSSNGSSSSNNTGTIVGVVIAVLAVLALAVGFFFWRRKRNARNSAQQLLTGASAAGGAAAGPYSKQRDSDEFFSGPTQAGALGGATDGEKNGYGSNQQQQQNFGSWQQQQQHNLDGGHYKEMAAVPGSRPSLDAPSYRTQTQQQQQTRAMSPQQYPPANTQGINTSTNLLAGAGAGAAVGAAAMYAGHRDQQDRHNEIESREMQQHLEDQRQKAAAAASNPPGASPFGDSPGQGAVHVVKRTFEPGLDDELVLTPGDRVQLLIKYDDGWALGVNLDSREHPPAKGVFPYDCLGEVVASAPAPQSGAVTAAPTTVAQQPLSTITEDEPNSAARKSMEPSLSYLSYDNDREDQHQQRVGSPSGSSTATAPQLPAMTSFRSDSPIDLSSASSSSAHQQQQQQASVPSIQIHSSDGANLMSPDLYGAPTPATSSSAAAFVPLPPSPTTPNAVPSVLQPGSPAVHHGNGDEDMTAAMQQQKKGARRTSSLVASRDADLFLALGEVLGRDDVR